MISSEQKRLGPRNRQSDCRMEMICLRKRTELQVPRIFRTGARLFGIVLVVLNVSACSDWLPHVDLAPTYEPPQYVVPASWHGASPFVEARPSDGELRPDWWTLYNDPVLNKLDRTGHGGESGSAGRRGAVRPGPRCHDEGPLAADPADRFGRESHRQSAPYRHAGSRPGHSDNRPRRSRWGHRVLGARFLVGDPQRDAGGDLPRRGARLGLGSRPPQPAGRNCV